MNMIQEDTAHKMGDSLGLTMNRTERHYVNKVTTLSIEETINQGPNTPIPTKHALICEELKDPGIPRWFRISWC